MHSYNYIGLYILHWVLPLLPSSEGSVIVEGDVIATGTEDEAENLVTAGITNIVAAQMLGIYIVDNNVTSYAIGAPRLYGKYLK